MKEKQVVSRQVHFRYQNAGRKEKSAILDEFIKITGYKNWKYALRILNKPQTPQALLVVKGKALKLKPQKKRLANRTGKKIYTDEVIAFLRLIWVFFWYKCGRKRSFRNSWPPLCGSRWTLSPCGRPSVSRQTSKLNCTVYAELAVFQASI
ncbi:MAG: hypothetical protein LBK02_01555 [Treponema sp.]|nr:hypothetical protein [Treponema sp.]